jgi:hypothetical protein
VRHWAIYLDLEGGTIRLSSREAEERPGPLPFSPPLKGAVTLICKDAQRQALSELTIHDPTVVRRVAGETEPPPEKEREIKQFELLLPPLKSIEFVEIVWPDKRPRAEFDVGDVLEKIKSGG